MMKKRARGIVFGVLLVSTMLTTVAFATTGSKTVEVFYNNIKLYVDGAHIVPKDANGVEVEPFTMNGTTYLPVRALSEALGKDVVWDGETQSVYIGKTDENQPDEYLSNLQKTYFEGREAVYPIIGSVTDIYGNDHTSGLIFTGDSRSQSSSEENPDVVTYALNSQYSTLKGNVFLPVSLDLSGYTNRDPSSANSGYTNLAKISIYGDDTLLEEIPAISRADVIAFDLDVSGVNEVRIEIRTTGSYIYSNVVALTNLALYK